MPSTLALCGMPAIHPPHYWTSAAPGYTEPSSLKECSGSPAFNKTPWDPVLEEMQAKISALEERIAALEPQDPEGWDES